MPSTHPKNISRLAPLLLLVAAGCPKAPELLGEDGGEDGGPATELDAGPSLQPCPTGSTLRVETPDAGQARFGSVFSDELYQVTDLEARPAGWVDQLDPSQLSARVVSAEGQPVAGCEVAWEALPGNGWVFPFAARTDAEGKTRAVWTAGDLAQQQLSLRIEVEGEGPKLATIDGLASPHQTRSNSIHIWYDIPQRWDTFSVDLTPITFPTTTYYAAIGFGGGYFGIQNRGPTVAPALPDKWVLFSVWDSPGGKAQLINAGPMTCEGFGGEGTGRKCWMTYDWKVGGTYRFEVSYTPGASYTDYTAYFTDWATGVRQPLATLRHAQVVSDWSVYSFVEDWFATGTSCLTTEERSAYFHGVQYQVASGWKRVPSARFSRVYNEWHNEICANYFYGIEDGKLLWSSGGDQRVARPLLRTDVGYPVVALP